MCSACGMKVDRALMLVLIGLASDKTPAVGLGGGSFVRSLGPPGVYLVPQRPLIILITDLFSWRVGRHNMFLKANDYVICIQ